jgi:hypothetical protein
MELQRYNLENRTMVSNKSQQIKEELFDEETNRDLVRGKRMNFKQQQKWRKLNIQLGLDLVIEDMTLLKPFNAECCWNV